MQTFIVGLAAAIILMLGGLLVLSSAGVTTVQATSTPAVHVATQ